MKKLNKEIREILDKADFCYSEVTKTKNYLGETEYEIDIYQGTPCGEDWHCFITFDGTNEGFCQAVKRYCDDFDVEEEQMPYIEMRGKNGVPNSIRDLIKDGEWKEETLDNLATELMSWYYENE